VGPDDYQRLRRIARLLASDLTRALREQGDGPLALRLAEAETKAYGLVRDLSGVLHAPQGPCCFGTEPCLVHNG
jgi:hypothetical protein